MSETFRPLRVLQVNSYFDGGGSDSQTLELATALRAYGDEVTLSVPETSRWAALARQHGLSLVTFHRRGLWPVAKVFVWARIIRERHIDVIHAHQGGDYWPAVLAASLSGRHARVVVSRHLVTRPRFLTRHFLLAVAHVVAVSLSVEAVLERELRGSHDRIRKISGGIDVARFSNSAVAAEHFRREHGWPHDALAFGMIGGNGLSSGKGHDEFLRAAAQVAARHDRVRFAMIGVDAKADNLAARVRDLGLEGRVSMVPFTDRVEAAIGALDVLAHPARGTEALGLVLLEAMAAGKPVIASRLGGIPEVVRDGENGFLVPPGDVEALAHAMEVLLTDPALRSRMGHAGRARVTADFSREQMALRTHALYATICADA